MDEWLSPPHSWVSTVSLKPRSGDVFVSRFRRPMLTMTEDSTGGMHDMLLAACDQFRYELFGHRGPLASCVDNLQTAMRQEGCEISVIPQPINFFTNVPVDSEGRLTAPANQVRPGAHVAMRALMDLIGVVSTCPFDLAFDGWQINTGDRPSKLEIAIA